MPEGELEKKSIVFWDRENGKNAIEQVYGDGAVRFLYENPIGQFIVDYFLSLKFFSWMVGLYQSSSFSRRSIATFIEKFEIPMGEYEDPGFGSFNDFFIRKFKQGARAFTDAPLELAAFAEARYLAYETYSLEQNFPVKGKYLTPETILGSNENARYFQGGPVVIARLCPVDYHRFHFPDDGKVVSHYRVPGVLHSVNPVALKYRGDIFAVNERHVTILKTKNFGYLAYVEVGALNVGKIVQSHISMHEGHPTMVRDFRRGDEKGYFLFGGSSVVLFGEKGAWQPDEDILENTTQRKETYIKLGARLGVSRL